ncbi:hypothetical protein [Streptomyces sp. KMM 9044]|uniref:hypothetical protein n=1 Tax=Streptomyces sp. KMM 9044 TaxID=2744474 RepID=UPI002150B29F|nr:hypothetical protein [Streptomyces sp. KMM 9044]WAX81673.1 hypothetical protein HUV60_032795 [Streptomyces sp. KMM 9044]
MTAPADTDAGIADGLDPVARAASFEGARAQALEDLTDMVGRVRACAALGVSRATYYRHHRQSPAPARARRERRRHPRALGPAEEERVLQVLRSAEFVDMAPGEIYAVLLDRGIHLCSESTMYRLLRKHGEVRERRRQATHPPRKKPELIAEGPDRVWSWSGSRREFQAPAPTEPCVTVCRYTALVTLVTSSMSGTSASARTFPGIAG